MHAKRHSNGSFSWQAHQVRHEEARSATSNHNHHHRQTDRQTNCAYITSTILITVIIMRHRPVVLSYGHVGPILWRPQTMTATRYTMTATAMKTWKINGVLLRNRQIHSEFTVTPSSEHMFVAVIVMSTNNKSTAGSITICTLVFWISTPSNHERDTRPGNCV